MGSPRHHLRSSRVALAALWVVMLVLPVAKAGAATSAAPRSEMKRNGCCCPTLPTGGCCCQFFASTATLTGVDDAASIVRIEPDPSGRTCHCRSSAPAAPTMKSDHRLTERRSHLDCSLLSVQTVPQLAPLVASAADRHAGPAVRCPLYLFLAHLLI